MSKVFRINWSEVPVCTVDDNATKLACFEYVLSGQWWGACTQLYYGAVYENINNSQEFLIESDSKQFNPDRVCVTISCWSRCRAVKWVLEGPWAVERRVSKMVALEKMFHLMYLSGSRASPHHLNAEQAKENIIKAQQITAHFKHTYELNKNAEIYGYKSLVRVLEACVKTQAETIRACGEKQVQLVAAVKQFDADAKVEAKKQQDRFGRVLSAVFEEAMKDPMALLQKLEDPVGFVRSLDDKDNEAEGNSLPMLDLTL